MSAERPDFSELPLVQRREWLAAPGFQVPEDWPRPSVEDVKLLYDDLQYFVPAEHHRHTQVAPEADDAFLRSQRCSNLLIAMYNALGVGDSGARKIVGVAAPQVAVLTTSVRRIMMMRLPEGKTIPGIDQTQIHRLVGSAVTAEAFGNAVVFINPRYESIGHKTYPASEGCRTSDGLAGFGPRYLRIRAYADNLDQPVELHDVPESGDWGERMGRCFQHETDHLYGIRWPDRLIQAMQQKKIPSRSLKWLYHEHRPGFFAMTDYVRRHPQEAASLQWPYNVPPEMWQARKEGLIVLPGPIT